MVITPEEFGLEEELYVDNNNTILNSTICNIFPSQQKNMSAWYKLMCGCECYITVKSMNSFLLTRCDNNMKQLKDKSHNAQNRRSGEIASHIFEIYKIM